MRQGVIYTTLEVVPNLFDARYWKKSVHKKEAKMSV